MNKQELLSHVDHTLLNPTATWEEIRALCDEGLAHGMASVCIPSSYVRQAAEYLDGRLPICTVIGFPNGYGTTGSKCCEASDAIQNGASEIDMVIHLGWVKDGLFDQIREEIQMVKRYCGPAILKVIIETCLLTHDEKVQLCRTVWEGGAQYIKTSTGFSTGGATREDVALLAEYAPAGLKVKASGGIRTLQDAEDFLSLGADRLGSSSLVRLAAEAED